MVTLLEENTDILRGIEERSGPLSHPRRVDFSFIFPSEPRARDFIEQVARDGFATSFDKTDDEDWPADVTVWKIIMPTAHDITEIEATLDKLAQGFGGSADGWGFFSDTIH